MKEYLNNILTNDEKGLFLCELPTGYGKTYLSTRAIFNYILKSKNKRKIIFLTTLNKNLPEEEFKAVFDDEELYNNTVLRIRSNFDEVVEKIPNIEIPKDFCGDSYYNLRSAIQSYNQAIKRNVKDAGYIAHLEKRINEAERAFRQHITTHLKKTFLSKKQRLNAIKNDPMYKWIGDLYPAVFTDNYRVLLMSVNKFMKKNSVLVEPSYDFLKASFIKDAIIFIDEFDATKATIKSEIIERSLSMKNDFLVLFRQLHRMLNTDAMSQTMRDAYSKIDKTENSKYSFKKIAKEADDIAKKYHTKLSYKTAEEGIDRKQNFLFNDGTFHTLLNNNAKYIRANVNKSENIVNIHFEDKQCYFENHKDDDIAIYGMIRDINSFLRHFKDFVFEWAKNYTSIENHKRKANRDSMTYENAILSILQKLELSPTQKELLIGEICEPLVKKSGSKITPEFSFYQNGIEIYEFEDSDSHNDNTNLNFVKVYDTPERLLIYLAKHCTVIGISATAEIPTVVGNYNLSYINECLESDFHKTPIEVKERIRTEINANRKQYENGNIKIHTEVVKNNYHGKEIREICKEFTDNLAVSIMCENLFKTNSVSDYASIRYCNIFYAMLSFCNAENINSMLYLGMALPKKNNPDFDEDILHRLMTFAVMVSCKKRSEIFILRKDNFDNDKDTLLNRLSNGEKIFIISSYNTLGAGQNLQYKISKKNKLIQINDCKNEHDKRFFTKDIDAIYLADTTNLTPNTYSGGRFDETTLMEMLFQIEELYSNGEFDYEEKDQMIKLAFDSYSSRVSHHMNFLYNTYSVRMQATKYLIQAIGRMCRTFIKSPDIYIFIEEKLLDKISASEIKKRVLPPEIEIVAKMRENFGKEYSIEESRILNIAEQISTKGMQWIRAILSRNWTNESMGLWIELRETVLRFPTASTQECNQNTFLRKLYISSGQRQCSYLYSQYSDFGNVTIDFSDNIIDFKNSKRAKLKGNTDEVAVYKMNELESGLPVALMYDGMVDYFLSKRYSIMFEEKEFMMSPVLFHNIYKGALGEVAGKYILNKERGIKFNPIIESDKFEFFDYMLNDGVYVDFKNWKFTYLKDRERIKSEILNKLESINGKRMYIINLIGYRNHKPNISADGRIIEIPGLIDNNGNPIYENINMIREEDYSDTN